MNYLLFFLLISTPVLYEGRFCPPETVPSDKEYLKLDVEDYHSLAGKVSLQAEGKFLKYPTYGQLRAELLLHYFPFKWIILAGYVSGLIMLILGKKRAAVLLILLGWLHHTLSLVLRCYVLSRPPVSNMSETLLYVPWISLLTGLIFRRRKTVLASSSLASAGLLLFLPGKISLDNVQAVLDSQYWLIVHVLMVVGSYGVFFVAGICGHWLLLKKNPSPSLEKALIQQMYLGTGMLICGTILGGVWAAESWGRFWDWDPKEAWAFISSGIYLIWIHAYRFKKIQSTGLAIGSIIGLMAITFTWYGVNYILGTGLHSYGFGNGGTCYYYVYIAIEVLFLTMIFLKSKYSLPRLYRDH